MALTIYEGTNLRVSPKALIQFINVILSFCQMTASVQNNLLTDECEKSDGDWDAVLFFF
jgi:hypothetical protein